MKVNSEFVERCQLEYEKNPRSKVFAPLAEAYRKMGLLEEAAKLCRRGVVVHPDFAGGRVAFAKVLLDLKQPAEALTQLQKAAELSPDNLLAHNLMGETLIELRRPKEALKAFKMVLFLNPSDEKAKAAVRKWEFLTADEYDAEVFQMRPVFAASLKGDGRRAATEGQSNPSHESDGSKENALARTGTGIYSDTSRAIERAVSLADAFTVRNDLEAALDVLDEARRTLGPVPDIDSRRTLLTKRLKALTEVDEEESHGPTLPDQPLGLPLSREDRRHRIEVLEDLLHRINIHRYST